jgi:hypothetical protein
MELFMKAIAKRRLAESLAEPQERAEKANATTTSNALQTVQLESTQPTTVEPDNREQAGDETATLDTNTKGDSQQQVSIEGNMLQ